MQRWRIVFFGTPEFAVPSLRALLAGPDPVVGVVCQPDKPAGRGQHASHPPVKRLALEAGVPLLQPAKVRTAEFLEGLRAWNPDLIVVAAYGRILPVAVLQLPPLGCINVHASLLPKYRGAAPIQWAILQGDKQTGITIMHMSEEMDAGDILLQRATAIGDGETYGELQQRLSDLGAATLQIALEELHIGHLSAAPQDPAQVSMAAMIQKEDGRIDWHVPAAQLARRVRAFNPWPSAFTSVKGKMLKVHRAHPAAATKAALPGTVTAVTPVLQVATADGDLCLDEVQLEGRKRMSAGDFVRGGQLQLGAVLGD